MNRSEINLWLADIREPFEPAISQESPQGEQLIPRDELMEMISLGEPIEEDKIKILISMYLDQAPLDGIFLEKIYAFTVPNLWKNQTSESVIFCAILRAMKEKVMQCL